MAEKEINIRYSEFDSAEDLAQPYWKLLDEAVKATESSYAPYSKFNVGAAVLMENGDIITGSNQENAASPSGLCAERVALFAAHHRWPGIAVKAIAIIGKSGGNITGELTYPCAACIQVMLESQIRSGKPLEIIVGSASKIQVFPSVDAMLPFSFGKLP